MPTELGTTRDKARGIQRLRVRLRGVVQGTGFRPFTCRLARQLGIGGWVANLDDGAILEAEGSGPALEEFIRRIDAGTAGITSIETSDMPAAAGGVFEIRSSEVTGVAATHITPDRATCQECVAELRDPANRRWGYPFVSCASCGPRFSILLDLPYDRANTTMRVFPLCRECALEFDDPTDRRFHAQTIACSACGPRLSLLDQTGRRIAQDSRALSLGLDALKAGSIVAVKGIGGFHLLTDACNEASIRVLRNRKRRQDKPFAVMYPSVEAVSADCNLSPVEAMLLSSAVAPIVLVRRRQNASLAPSVSASASLTVGALLPYTPLHHLLADSLGLPLIATSGNVSGEPLATSEHEAVTRLGGIADLFLTHDRTIARPLDDSVVRAVAGERQVIRLGRGLAPVSIPTRDVTEGCLAVGGHLKNAIAIGSRGIALVSQHLGDLDNVASLREFRRAIEDMESVSKIEVTRTATDAHPDYLSSRQLDARRIPGTPVQHHSAHIRSVMAENGLTTPVLGVAWDGGGWGNDGTIWGGEFLETHPDDWRRVAHLVQFALPGGEMAVREPWRVAVAVLVEAGIPYHSLRIPPGVAGPDRIRQVAELAGANRRLTPRTSSMGRLFDAVASIVGLRHTSSFEGQAAIELEGIITAGGSRANYPIELIGTGPILIDWRPMIREIMSDVHKGVRAEVVSAMFHSSLVETLVAVSRRVGLEKVALSGGCFQNRWLSEQAIVRLRRAGFGPYWHHQVPPNDGGLSLGQLMAASRRPA